MIGKPFPATTGAADGLLQHFAWRKRVRDLLLRIGVRADPGDWVFHCDQAGLWTWEYATPHAISRRSTSSFRTVKKCLKDANEHGFSSLFSSYSICRSDGGE
jgi:hypothetical protein